MPGGQSSSEFGKRECYQLNVYNLKGDRGMYLARDLPPDGPGPS